MNKLFASLLIAGAVALSAVAAQSMPLASDLSQDSLVVPVAGGCGVGWHRGPYGGCRRNYYGGPAVVVPGPVVPGPVVVAPAPYYWHGRYYYHRYWYRGGWRYR
jgi:hypothetical protein